jgi:myosin-6
MPRATDKTLTDKVHKVYEEEPALHAPQMSEQKGARRLKEDEAFVLRHFAGDVTYETDGFLDKNNDTIHDSLLEVLSVSKSAFVAGLRPAETEAEASKYGPQGGRFKSVSTRFSLQLKSLMATLNSTSSHFIRCIKPNQVQKPAVLERAAVMTQLRYSGMCAALLLMQAGFPTRVSFDEMYMQYSGRMPVSLQRLKPKLFCEALLVALELDGERDFQVGLTKIFFRPGKLGLIDELTAGSSTDVNRIIKKVRHWVARHRWFAAAHCVRSLCRLQSLVYGHRAMRTFRRTARVALYISRGTKNWLAAVRSRIYSEEVLKVKQEAEDRRLAAAAAERARMEAEEEAKRQAVIEEARQVEAAKQAKVAEERRALQDKIDQLAQSNDTQHSFFQDEVNKHDETRARLLEEQEALAVLTEKMVVAEKEIVGEKDKVAGLQADLDAEKGVLVEVKLEAETAAIVARDREEERGLKAHAKAEMAELAALARQEEATAQVEKKAAAHVTELEAKIVKLELELQNECDELETAGLAAGKLREKVDELEAKVVSTAAELAASEVEVADRDGKLVAADQTKAALEGKIAEANGLEATLSSNLAEQAAKISAMEGQIATLEGTVTEKEVRIIELEKKCCTVM